MSFWEWYIRKEIIQQIENMKANIELIGIRMYKPSKRGVFDPKCSTLLYLFSKKGLSIYEITAGIELSVNCKLPLF